MVRAVKTECDHKLQTGNQMAKIVIELDGPIAAGKTTLKSKIIARTDKNKITLIDLSKHGKFQKLRGLLKAITENPRLAISSYWHIAKTGKSYYNTTVGRMRAVTACLIKEALCQDGKINIIDEGITKRVDPEKIIDALPADSTRILLYVTASPAHRKKRISERYAKNPRIKPQHASLLEKSDAFLHDKKEQKWHALKNQAPFDILFFYSDDEASYERSFDELERKLAESGLGRRMSR